MFHHCHNSSGLRLLNVAFVSLFLIFSAIPHASAQNTALDGLFLQLQDDDQEADLEAIEQDIWQEWRKSGSDAVDFLLERGMAAMQEGQMRQAISHFTTVIEQAPEFAEGYNMRATAYFMMNQYGLSVADIERTLALEPRHFGALGGLGMIMERTDRPKQALFAYEKLLEVHPKSPQAKDAVERLKDALEGTAL